ncbi:MAG TPA: terminase family protein [Nitrospira sp.]|nr:terminase family protein [Nitrospira sp.]
MKLIEAIKHPQLFGALPAFTDLRTWTHWLVVLKALEGLPLNPQERAIFEQHTGRTYAPPPGGFPELAVIVGVQSGKSTIAGVLMGHAALTGKPGTFALGICQDHRGAMRVLLRYARAPFETLDLFRAEVARSTADTLELRNGVTLAAYPCRPEAVRGLRASIVVVDELAFFTATDGRPMDQEMLRVARGRLATTGGKLIVISSPYGQSGALWDLHRKHYGQDKSSTLIWQASAPDMNPTLPADYLQRMEQDDPDAYRSEVLGEFRAGVSTFLDAEVLQQCVDDGVRERARQPGVPYTAFCDAASGSGKDAFTAGFSHEEHGVAVLDLIRVWRPPFNPSGVIAELSALCQQWGIHAIGGDSYAPGFVQEAFRANGVTYVPSPLNRSDLYLGLLPLINSHSVRLLDHPDLLRELRGLERRRGTSGRDRIDHRRGSHDDVANSAAGALVNAKQASVEPRIRDFLTDDERRQSELMASQRQAVGAGSWGGFLRGH